MSKKEKFIEVMESNEYDMNKAKDLLSNIADTLEENGLSKEAETLARMVFKIEAFQNKYGW